MGIQVLVVEIMGHHAIHHGGDEVDVSGGRLSGLQRI